MKKKVLTRSENMSRIKNADTKPEIFLRKLLWHKGFRYRTNYKKLPGKPDIYIPKYRTAIFVNGCFWHMHQNCSLSSIPKSNSSFWLEKLTSNVNRDQKNYTALKKAGIKVIIVWGCEIKEMMKDIQKQEHFLLEVINKILCDDFDYQNTCLKK